MITTKQTKSKKHVFPSKNGKRIIQLVTIQTSTSTAYKKTRVSDEKDLLVSEYSRMYDQEIRDTERALAVLKKYSKTCRPSDFDRL